MNGIATSAQGHDRAGVTEGGEGGPSFPPRPTCAAAAFLLAGTAVRDYLRAQAARRAAAVATILPFQAAGDSPFPFPTKEL